MIWALMVTGIALALCSIGYLYVGRGSVDWPTVQGKVLFSELLELKTNSATTYQPSVVYEYEVNGVSRKSRTIGFYAGTEGKEWARRLLVGRPVGAEVTVYYHPQFPRIAILEPGIKQTWAWIILALLGALFAVSSGVVLIGDNPYAFVDFLFGLF